MIVDKNIAQNRYNICKKCEYFSKTSRQCTKCFCFMPLKVKFIGSECPLEKWSALPLKINT